VGERQGVASAVSLEDQQRGSEFRTPLGRHWTEVVGGTEQRASGRHIACGEQSAGVSGERPGHLDGAGRERGIGRPVSSRRLGEQGVRRLGSWWAIPAQSSSSRSSIRW